LVSDFKENYLDAGSLSYMAPELFTNAKNKVTTAIDIWSMGVILYG